MLPHVTPYLCPIYVSSGFHPNPVRIVFDFGGVSFFFFFRAVVWMQKKCWFFFIIFLCVPPIQTHLQTLQNNREIFPSFSPARAGREGGEGGGLYRLASQLEFCPKIAPVLSLIFHNFLKTHVCLSLSQFPHFLGIGWWHLDFFSYDNTPIFLLTIYASEYPHQWGTMWTTDPFQLAIFQMLLQMHSIQRVRESLVLIFSHSEITESFNLFLFLSEDPTLFHCSWQRVVERRERTPSNGLLGGGAVATWNPAQLAV